MLTHPDIVCSDGPNTSTKELSNAIDCDYNKAYDEIRRNSPANNSSSSCNSLESLLASSTPTMESDCCCPPCGNMRKIWTICVGVMNRLFSLQFYCLKRFFWICRILYLILFTVLVVLILSSTILSSHLSPTGSRSGVQRYLLLTYYYDTIVDYCFEHYYDEILYVRTHLHSLHKDANRNSHGSTTAGSTKKSKESSSFLETNFHQQIATMNAATLGGSSSSSNTPTSFSTGAPPQSFTTTTTNSSDDFPENFEKLHMTDSTTLTEGTPRDSLTPIELASSSSSLASSSSVFTVDAAATTSTTSDETVSAPPVCSIYLAPSTIPHAGLGIFAGKAFETGTIVTPPDLVIPLLDVSFYNQVHRADTITLFDDYVWRGYNFPGMMYSHVDQGGIYSHIQGFSPGFGAIPNCFIPLVNIGDTEKYDKESNGNYVRRDIANLQPYTLSKTNNDEEFYVNPMLGAFSVYHGRSSSSNRDIAQGEELFVNYGANYFKSRSEIYGLIPFKEDYKHADVLLHKYRKLSNRFSKKGFRPQQSHKLSSESKTSELPETCTLNITNSETTTTNGTCSVPPSQQQSNTPSYNRSFTDDLYDLLKRVVQIWPTRLQGALPMSSADVDTVLDVIGTTSKIHYNRSIRSVEELERLGSCMDHIVVKDSTLPNAGRGAFANKFLPTGSVVTPVPLIHISNRSIFHIYPRESIDNEELGNPEQTVIHEQLTLNYCFGHRDSVLLLCPYGIASLAINHGPSIHSMQRLVQENQNLGLVNNVHASHLVQHQQQQNQPMANVKIVWSKKNTLHPEWWDMPTTEWSLPEQEHSSGLAFDYVAIRDIQEGEEIFLDYGFEWMEAYQRHIQLYNQTIPIPLSQKLNEEEHEIPIYQSNQWIQKIWNDDVNDLESIPVLNMSMYQNIHTWCHRREIESILKNYNDVLNALNEDNVDAEYYPCRLLDKRKIVIQPRKTQSSVSSVTDPQYQSVYTADIMALSFNKDLYEKTVSTATDADNETLEDEEGDSAELGIKSCKERRANILLLNIPRSSIRFGSVHDWDEMQRMYEETWSFRHDMRIPDHLMPQAWKTTNLTTTI